MGESNPFGLYVTIDNKLHTDYPEDTRYYLAIYYNVLIELLEEHYVQLDMLVRVIRVDDDPLRIVLRHTLDKIADFEIGFAQVQQIAYTQNWYSKVANILLTKV
jgi:hypothetical protein